MSSVQYTVYRSLRDEREYSLISIINKSHLYIYILYTVWETRFVPLCWTPNMFLCTVIKILSLEKENKLDNENFLERTFGKNKKNLKFFRIFKNTKLCTVQKGLSSEISQGYFYIFSTWAGVLLCYSIPTIRTGRV